MEGSNLNKYPVGRQDTLKKEGIIDALNLFYEVHYSSYTMSLVIHHNMNLDELGEKVTSIFEGIPNKSLEPISYKNVEFPYEKNVNKLVKMVSTGNNNVMNITWTIPQEWEDKYNKPYKFVTNL